MNHDEPRAQIGYRGGAISRAKNLALKAAVGAGAALMLASAFVLSLAFLTVGLVVVLTAGGYVWWKTRELRRQMREQMQVGSHPGGRIIEGEVISQERPRR